MSDHTIIIVTSPQVGCAETITLEQFYRRRVQRKWRVAKRLFRQVPLFTVELMQEEFPEINQAEVDHIVSRPTQRTRSKRKKKIGLKKYGRYPLYLEALERYQTTGDLTALTEA